MKPEQNQSILKKRTISYELDESPAKMIKQSKNQYKAAHYYGEVLNTLISLKDDFKIERKCMRFFERKEPQKNKYLSSEQQQQCSVDMDQFLISFPNKEVLEGEYNFCLTAEQSPRLLCSKSLHHSFLANGKKVFGIGTLTFENGRLFKISNHSGHYKPTNNEMMQVIKALYRASDEDLKIYTSYSNNQPETFPVLEILQHDDFEELTPIASNEEINIETGAVESTEVLFSDYNMPRADTGNDLLFLNFEKEVEYRQLCMSQ